MGNPTNVIGAMPAMGYQSFDKIPQAELAGIGEGYQQNIKDDFAAGKYAGATPEMWDIMLGKMRQGQKQADAQAALRAPHQNAQMQENMAYAQALRQPRFAQEVPTGPQGQQYGARVAAPQFGAPVNMPTQQAMLAQLRQQQAPQQDMSWTNSVAQNGGG